LALLLIEGFDQYASDGEILAGGWSGDVAGFSTAATGRNGRGINVNASGSYLSRFITPSSATFVFGFAVEFVNSVAANTDVINLFDSSGTEKITLRWLSGGTFHLDRGSTSLGSFSFTAVMATWYFIEIKVTLHDSTGAFEVWIDGDSKMSGSGVDTLNGTEASIANVRLVGNSIIDWRFDDIYFLDNTGSDNTDRLGDVRVETVSPNADGTTNDFTRISGSANYEMVDDIADPDDDTTYNHSSTASDKELYGFAALTGDVGTVFGVQVSVLARKEDPGARDLRLVARSSATEVQSGNKQVGTEYTRYINHIYENDPNGGIDWTETSVNAAEFGFLIQA